MAFGHEKPDVYRLSLEYVGWVYGFTANLKGHRNAKDQLIRASQAIPLNIAEGNGKATDGDRRRIVAMLTKLGRRGYSVKEEATEYRILKTDTDTDPEKEAEPNIKSVRRTLT